MLIEQIAKYVLSHLRSVWSMALGFSVLAAIVYVGAPAACAYRSSSLPARVSLHEGHLRLEVPPFSDELRVSMAHPADVTTVAVEGRRDIAPHATGQTVSVLTIQSFDLKDRHTLDIQFGDLRAVTILNVSVDGRLQPVGADSEVRILNRWKHVYYPDVTGWLGSAVSSVAAVAGDLANLTLAVFCAILVGRTSISTYRLLSARRSVETPDHGGLGSRSTEWLRFAHAMQIIGPTIGFLFTAVGLASALSTTGTSNLDLETFYLGLNVAMVSTALGLIVRLMAQVLHMVETALQMRISQLTVSEPNVDPAAT